jgi:hypothetical protein
MSVCLLPGVILLILLDRLLCLIRENRLLQAVYHVVVVYPEFLGGSAATTSILSKIFKNLYPKWQKKWYHENCSVGYLFPMSGVSRNEHFPMVQTVFV